MVGERKGAKEWCRGQERGMDWVERGGEAGRGRRETCPKFGAANGNPKNDIQQTTASPQAIIVNK